MKNIAAILLLFMVSDLINAQDCSAFPEFMKKMDFDGYNTAFSTNEIDQVGIVAYELKDRYDLHSEKVKFYKDESWSKAGYLGPIVYDEQGNIYTAPLPKVNTLDNPPEDQNTIYIIDTNTGVMKEFYKLPVDALPNSRNPFGIMGLHYDCESGLLFVSTISGSSSEQEIGKIFSLDIKSKILTEIISDVDALGLGILNHKDQKYLIYGEARNSIIRAVLLDDSNHVSGNQNAFIDLTGLGIRGDDKARKFQIKEGQLDIYAVPFMYNLAAPRVKQESVYTFKFALDSDKWVLVSIR